TIVNIDATTQSNPDWGLDRIDQKALPLNSAYSYLQTGSGTTAYIVDTGILSSHQEFSGRVLSGYTAISDGNGTTDCNGHGTHVAGTVGGTTYGVAKNVNLVPIRILGCDGSGASSNVIAGLDWILKNGKKPAVVNMSLGGATSSSLDSAVENLFNNGYVMVVAAGNSNTDACSSSPARVSKAITVAATDNTDTRASYSNYGSCVDIFAPGSQINSSWIGSNTATKILNGTSMATPHVAGVVAEMLQSTPTA
ncbi:S8 family peptidase, partial [Acinetobacter baumannii]